MTMARNQLVFYMFVDIVNFPAHLSRNLSLSLAIWFNNLNVS